VAAGFGTPAQVRAVALNMRVSSPAMVVGRHGVLAVLSGGVRVLDMRVLVAGLVGLAGQCPRAPGQVGCRAAGESGLLGGEGAERAALRRPDQKGACLGGRAYERCRGLRRGC
jgi:hypothetical protein